MSAEVLDTETMQRRRVVPAVRMPAPVVMMLAVIEAKRMLCSPAIPAAAGYVLLVGLVDLLRGSRTSQGTTIGLRQMALDGSVAFGLLLLGPFTVIAANLVATSSRRRHAAEQLSAAQVSQRGRDMALCLGILGGPAMLALALSLAAAWLTSGLSTPYSVYPDTMTWTDVAQGPAMVLGGGLLGIVLARWAPVPGAPLVGFAALIALTFWLVAGGYGSVRVWFAPFLISDWRSGGSAHPDGWMAVGSQAWHTAYLYSLSALGVCAIGVRHAERRGRWLGMSAIALGVVVATGWLQLP